jgi:sarcosine oxidase/L-pipecolate oxidase
LIEPQILTNIAAGIFGLSLAIALRDKGKDITLYKCNLTDYFPDYEVTVFDRSQYDANGYDPASDDVQAASADHNKIVCEYQRQASKY